MKLKWQKTAKILSRKVLKWGPLLLIIFAGKLLWFETCKLEEAELLTELEGHDLLARRRYLLRKVADPDFGPDNYRLLASPFREELAIATLSMTTMALTNIAYRFPETRKGSLKAIDSMIEKMLTPAIRKYEVIWWGEDALDTLEKDRGHIGYLGHLNLMLACYRLLGGGLHHDQLFKDISAALARRAEKGSGYHVETFPNYIFTADNTIVLATLALHDRIFSPLYQDLIKKWVEHTKNHLLDRDSGMILYHVGLNGQGLGTPRGVLQAWNSMWLPLLDRRFARQQYQTMKILLKDEVAAFNLGGIREYPKGKSGPTDFVAGPIVLGISSAATGFATAGASWWKDRQFLNQLLRTAELIGSTVELREERFYLLAPLVGEAVVLACRTMGELDRRFLLEESKEKAAG